MKTLGIDLSVNLADTGVCQIDWGERAARVTFREPADDNYLLSLIAGASDTVAIDVPLGWPEDFALSVAQYMEKVHGRWPSHAGPFKPNAYFRLRETDRAAAAIGHEVGEKINPISVSADKLGASAMKAAWLVTKLSWPR